MKQYLLYACALMMFLSGCGRSDTNTPPESLSETSAQSSSQAEDSPINLPDISKPDAPKSDISILESPTLVQTEYYNVTLLESWLEDCIHEMVSGEDGNYFLYFYEKQSYEQIGGGLLFSLNLLPITEDYTYFPAYDELGTLETPEGERFNLIVLYPTDVQFEPDTQEKYMELDKQVPQVVASVTPVQGCILSSIVSPVSEVEGSRANGNWVHSPNALESWHLTINSDGTYLSYHSSMGEVKETKPGHYEILADDGTYQTFSFLNDDGSDSWTAQIWQTTLNDQQGVSYDGLVYITSGGETLYFTGAKYS